MKHIAHYDNVKKIQYLMFILHYQHYSPCTDAFKIVMYFLLTFLHETKVAKSSKHTD